MQIRGEFERKIIKFVVLMAGNVYNNCNSVLKRTKNDFEQEE